MDDVHHRLRTLEAQVAYLFRHFGLDPADAVPAAGGDLAPEVVQLHNVGH